MTPTNPERARILELGCGNGNNVVPIAAIFPNAEVVGVDLSKDAIDEGLRTVAELNLKNVALHCQSIADINASFGKFDYIICHGIFSWVDDSVRAEIMRVCGENLAPQGIAYVSYNCLPGWHYRGLARELMQFHAGRFEEFPLFVAQSRAILDFMAQHATRDSIYHQTLKREVETIQNIPDWHLFHDYLEQNNRPFYFHEVASMAKQNGLQYLGDTEVSKLVPQEFPQEVQTMLGKFSTDIIQLEQYMDFLRNRMFRRTLLCHEGIPLRREFRPQMVFEMLVGAQVQRDPKTPDLFRHANGGSVRGIGTAMTSALDMLSRVWPHAVPVHRLFEATRDRHPEVKELATPEGATIFASGLLRLFLAEIVEFRTTRFPIANAVPEKPQVFPMARAQAAKNTPSGARATSALHEEIGLNPFLQSLVQLANGTLTVDQLTAEIYSKALPNTTTPDVVSRQVEGALQYLLRNGLISAETAS